MERVGTCCLWFSQRGISGFYTCTEVTRVFSREQLLVEYGERHHYANPGDNDGSNDWSVGKQVGKYCTKCTSGTGCECCSGGSGKCQPENCTSNNCKCCKDKDGGAISSFNAFTSQGLMIVLAFTGDGYLKTYSKYEHEYGTTGNDHGHNSAKNGTHDTNILYPSYEQYLSHRNKY